VFVVRVGRDRVNHAVGVAVYLFLGAFVTDLAIVPPAVVAYVSRQMDEDDTSVVSGYDRGGTVARHRQLVRDHDGCRQLSDPAVALGLARWLTERAWIADQRPETLFELAAARLRWAALSRVPASRIEAAVATVEARANRTPAGALERLGAGYPALRRWLPGVLASLELDGNEASRPVLGAWTFVRGIEGRRRPDLTQAPTEVVRGPWRHLVWDDTGAVSRALYTCVLDQRWDGRRRRILVQLNRGESRHALARAAFFGRRGQLRQAYRQGQEDQLGALGLVANAIALWNTD
jgi:hypothetical protein